jgi:glucokinase
MVIGLDVGGTVLKAVAVGPDGCVTRRVRQLTGASCGPEAVVTRIAELLAAFARQVDTDGSPARAVGVVVPGIIDEQAGVARFAGNLGWRDLPLRDILEERLSLPVVLGHDVRQGAVAEGLMGAARGVDDYAFIPLGTGIAAAVVLGGRPWRGVHGGAGELGHTRAESSDEPCACGGRGCLERVASASAIARRYRQRAGGDAIDASDVWLRRVAGDAIATAVWTEAVDALAAGFAVLQSTLDLELFVVGGGLAEVGAPLVEDLDAALASRLTFQVRPRIALAVLGDAAGSLGAAILARDALALAERRVTTP